MAGNGRLLTVLNAGFDPQRLVDPFQNGHLYGGIRSIHAGHHLGSTCKPASADKTCTFSTFYARLII
jgi:hypothetical protein